MLKIGTVLKNTRAAAETKQLYGIVTESQEPHLVVEWGTGIETEHVVLKDGVICCTAAEDDDLTFYSTVTIIERTARDEHATALRALGYDMSAFRFTLLIDNVARHFQLESWQATSRLFEQGESSTTEWGDMPEDLLTVVLSRLFELISMGKQLPIVYAELDDLPYIDLGTLEL